MSAGNQSVPAALGKMLACLPAYPGSLAFVTGLNLALARHLSADTQGMLEGRPLRILARDAGVCVDFMWRDERFVAQKPGGAVALTIAASVDDFILMAQRKEDPDTLFFNRRLTMEGDTELGLMVKNTLDSLELPVFSPGGLLPGTLTPGALFSMVGRPFQAWRRVNRGNKSSSA